MKRRGIAVLLLAAACLLTGCAKTATDEEAFGFRANSQSPQAMAMTENGAAIDGEVELEDEIVPLAELPVFFSMPEASGTEVAADNSAEIDSSNAQDGYVMARYVGEGGKALRVQVQGASELYTYELSPGQWAAFPLAEGSGTYQVTVLENTSGKRYAILVSAEIQAELDDELAPFLRPTENVDYENAENLCLMAEELTKEAQTPLEQAKAVYEYVTKFIADDGVEAAGGKSGYTPVLDEVLAAGMGSYYDRAALMAGMLRSQGVPCRVSVGYTGKARHTRVGVWTEETGWVNDAIFYDGENWQWTEPDDAGRPGSGSRYTVKFVY